MDAELNELVEEDVAAKLSGLDIPSGSAAAVDPLRSDSELLYARLQGLGRTDLFRLYDGVVHGFMQMSLVLPQASQAFRDAADAFRILLPSSDPNSFQESDK